MPRKGFLFRNATSFFRTLPELEPSSKPGILSALLTGIILFSFVFPFYALESKEKEWSGRLSNGKILAKKDFKKIFEQHIKWLNQNQEGLQADLSGATLTRIDLSDSYFYKANLFGADLRNADLSRANFSEADLIKSNLRGASLVQTNLNRAYLFDADLRDANLRQANLRGAYLHGADLSRADFLKAILISAKLIDTKIKGADFSDSDLADACFEPDPEPIPFSNTYSLATAKNLSSLRFENSSRGMTALRESFRILGFKKQEREVTYAIRHSEIYVSRALGKNKVSTFIKECLFEKTCRWGLYPKQCLDILFRLIGLFYFFYLLVLLIHWKHGIWKIWPAHGVQVGERKKAVRLTFQWENKKGYSQIGYLFRYLFYYPLLIIFLSTFNVGWRNFNMTYWATYILPHNYILKTSGWVRVISGFQTFISLYLLTLFLVTSFSNPF